MQKQVQTQTLKKHPTLYKVFTLFTEMMTNVEPSCCDNDLNFVEELF